MVGDKGTSGYGTGTAFEEDTSTSRGRSLLDALPPDSVASDKGYVPQLRERVSVSFFKHALSD
jgi:hypothetical protein